MRGITNTVKHLLIINAIMFLGTLTLGNGELFYRLFALYFPKNDLFQPWQIITHMFMHGNFMHILFNMFALWMFGTAVEQVFGWKKFLFFYISSGLGAAAVMLGFYYFKYLPAESALISDGLAASDIKFMLTNNKLIDGITEVQKLKLQDMFTIYNSTMVGASGAIMGVLVAFGMLFPDSKLMLIFLPIPIKAKYFIPGIIALDLISALTGQSFFSPSNTAYMAHVGGALTGFLMMWYWKKTQFKDKRWN
ncbi:Membrane associated serine protease, rhomboid family [Flavobacteriaceae bacterium MAR_2010_188]|nr:Membrane associated serine protease, rhomboid family [Flavobacteriaceae bacterium MAR_2010_188]